MKLCHTSQNSARTFRHATAAHDGGHEPPLRWSAVATRSASRQPHTSECRARFAQVMKEDARYQNAEKRKQEFEDKMREEKALSISVA